jgi:nucleoside-diphosphate kinase
LIELNGFSILRMQKVLLSKKEAEAFYAVHKKHSFFDELITGIIAGPVVLLALERDDAVSQWRHLIGATNPMNAALGTIRKMYAKGISSNAVHGSDSNENANIELQFFFKDLVI